MATGHKRDNSGNIVTYQTSSSSTDNYPSHNTANSSKPTRRFECTFEGCGKSYTRAEHLGRHQLNHNPKDIYKCDFPGCKREFVRQDLCARHRERHDAPSGKATEPNTSDDDDGEMSTRRVGRPRLSSLTRNGSSVRMGDGQASTTSNHEARISDGYDTPAPVAAPDVTITAPHVIERHLTSPVNHQPNTFQSNPTSVPHPYTTNMTSSQMQNRVQPLRTMSEYTLPALDESPGSVRDEFTAWLFDELPSQHVSGPFLNPSMSMNLFGPTSDFMSFGTTPMFSDYTNEAVYDPNFGVDTATTSTSDFDAMTSDDVAWISPSKRSGLIELMQNRFIDAENNDITSMRQEIFGEDMDAEDHVLSLRSMQLYLGSYWKHFHQQMPILHQPTFSADTSNDLLVLAVMIIGASQLSGRHGRPKTTAAAKFATFVAWHLRWQIFMHVDFRPPAKLWVFQTMLLLEIFEKTSSTRPMHERAHVHSATMINLMRRGTTLIGDDENRRTPGPTTADETWHRWIETESTRRAAFAAFVTDATHAVMFGHAAIMVVHELKLPLPCDDALWSATSAAEVGRVHASLHTHGIKPTTFLDGLKRTLTGKKVKTNSFGRTILMAGLLSITWHLHQRDLQVSSLGASSSLGAPGTWREALYKSFEFWKRDFDESMSHMKNASLPWHQITSSEDRDACTAADVLHHLSHITLHVEILDCQIFAGAHRLFGRTISRADYERSKQKLMEWAKSSAARTATFHALRLLKPLITQLRSSSDMFNCREDYLLNRAWVLYYALLVLWSYGYALDGLLRPFPVELPTTSTNYPSPEMSWGHVQTPTTSESHFQARLDDARVYFNTVGNVKSPDDLIMLQTGRNRLVGVLGCLGRLSEIPGGNFSRRAPEDLIEPSKFSETVHDKVNRAIFSTRRRIGGIFPVRRKNRWEGLKQSVCPTTALGSNWGRIRDFPQNQKPSPESPFTTEKPIPRNLWCANFVESTIGVHCEYCFGASTPGFRDLRHTSTHQKAMILSIVV